MSKNTIQATDLYRMQLIQDACISPDGKYVVSSVQRIREKDQKKFPIYFYTKSKLVKNWYLQLATRMTPVPNGHPMEKPSLSCPIATMKNNHKFI